MKRLVSNVLENTYYLYRFLLLIVANIFTMHHLFTLRTFCTAQMLFVNDLQDSWRIPHKATAYISCFAIHKPFTFSKNMFICIVRTPITPMFVSQVNIVLKTGNMYWRHMVQQRSCSLHCLDIEGDRATKFE